MPKLTCLGKGKKDNLRNTFAPAFYMEKVSGLELLNILSKITTISSPM